MNTLLMPRGEYWGGQIASSSCEGLLLTLVAYAPGHAPMHMHEHPGLFFLLRGQHKEGQRNGAVEQPVLTGIWHGTSDAHETWIGPEGMVGLNISIKRCWAAQVGLDDSSFSRTPVHNFRLTLLGLQLASATQGSASPEDSLNLALETISLLDRSSIPKPCRRVRRVRQRIEEEFADPVKISDYALDEGIHPVYLARAFRKGYGCTVTEYLQRRRLVEALRLVSSGHTVGEAAVGAGFADQSHLTRLCKRHLGVPPGRLKQVFVPSMV